MILPSSFLLSFRIESPMDQLSVAMFKKSTVFVQKLFYECTIKKLSLLAVKACGVQKIFVSCTNMPKTNDTTDVTADELRNYAERIREVAKSFDQLAESLENANEKAGENAEPFTVALAIDTFEQYVMSRIEGFGGTIDRERRKFAADVAKRIRERITKRREKKRKP